METVDLFRGARVLVDEDEYALADDIARAMREAGAATVGPVGRPGEAEAPLAREQIGAAVIDIDLHGEMAYRIAEQLSRSRVPCLIVSGYSEEALAE